MVNLEFHFFIFLGKHFSFKLFKFYIFSRFLYNKYNFFILQWIFIYNFYFCAIVLLNSNLLKLLKYLYPFLSYAKNILFLFFQNNFLLNLSKKIRFFGQKVLLNVF